MFGGFWTIKRWQERIQRWHFHLRRLMSDDVSSEGSRSFSGNCAFIVRVFSRTGHDERALAMRCLFYSEPRRSKCSSLGAGRPQGKSLRSTGSICDNAHHLLSQKPSSICLVCSFLCFVNAFESEARGSRRNKQPSPHKLLHFRPKDSPPKKERPLLPAVAQSFSKSGANF